MLLVPQILSVQQLHRICTLYWDDNYNTRSVSPEVSHFSFFFHLPCCHSDYKINLSVICSLTSITGYSQYEGANDRGVEHCK